MFDIFQSKEDRRIKVLFRLFHDLILKGAEYDSALMGVWGELNTQGTQLKNKYGFQERDTESKKLLINKLYGSYIDKDFDIYKSIQFIIKWESPKFYNHKLTIEEIRSGENPEHKLETKVDEIGRSILIKSHND